MNPPTSPRLVSRRSAPANVERDAAIESGAIPAWCGHGTGDQRIADLMTPGQSLQISMQKNRPLYLISKR